MYLRPCLRKKNGKPHTYWALVESYRTARGSRQAGGLSRWPIVFTGMRCGTWQDLVLTAFRTIIRVIPFGYADASWQAIGKEILEVPHETMSPEELAEMIPEELVHWGYAQGAGHLIMAMLAREVRLELISAQARVQKTRRPRGRRPHTAPED